MQNFNNALKLNPFVDRTVIIYNLFLRHTLLSIKNGEVEELESDAVYDLRQKESTACSEEFAGQKICYLSSYPKERAYNVCFNILSAAIFCCIEFEFPTKIKIIFLSFFLN